MPRALVVATTLVLLLASTEGLGVSARKVRWIASVYEGTEGVGLKYPEGVACGQQQLFVADTGNSRLLRFGYEGELITPEAEFPLPKSSPIAVQVNSKGDLYVLDGRDRRILRLSSTGEARGTLVPRGLPSPAEIVPRSFRIDGNDNIYILDIFSDRVLVLDADGGYLRQIAFPESFGFFSDVSVDSKGNVLILDSVEAVVYSARATADRFLPLTDGMKDYMNFPTSLATDSGGVIYLVDQHGSGLAVVGADGSFLGRRLGMGWKESRLYYPSQICIDEDDRFFIADRSNSRVQFFSLVGD